MHISKFPFHEIRLDKENPKAVHEKLTSIKAHQFGQSLLQQLLAEFGAHKLNAAGPNNTISGIKYLEDNLDRNNPTDVGKYYILTLDTRSALIKGMTSTTGRNYCNLVPLILYAHKLYNGVPYSKWDRDTIAKVVGNTLAEAMLAELPEVSTEKLLEYRDLALNGGAKPISITSAYTIYRLRGSEIGHLSNLSKIMMLQTWCAHPSIRTSNMILDPSNWDAMPPILAGDTVTYKEPDTAPW